MALFTARFASHPRLVAASESNPSLRRGERGDAVAALQLALVDLGFAMPRSTGGGKQLPDGIFGPETEEAVKAFQRANGLTADGIAGRLTFAALEPLIQAQSAARASAQGVAFQFRPASH